MLNKIKLIILIVVRITNFLTNALCLQVLFNTFIVDIHESFNVINYKQSVGVLLLFLLFKNTPQTNHSIEERIGLNVSLITYKLILLVAIYLFNFF